MDKAQSGLRKVSATVLAHWKNTDVLSRSLRQHRIVQESSMLQIDSALDDLSEAIGAILKRNRREDASGARRAIASRLASDDLKTAAVWLGCSEDEAPELRAKFERH